MPRTHIVTSLLLAALVLVVLGNVTRLKGQALYPGDYMYNTDVRYSPNGSKGLEYRCTNACYLSWNGGCPLWLSYGDSGSCPGSRGTHIPQSVDATSSGYATMQSDGNFALYNGSGTPVWSTNTAGLGSVTFFNPQDDGNLVLYYGSSTPVWSLF